MQRQIGPEERPYGRSTLIPFSTESPLTARLHGLLSVLGTGGGRISASVYDTAQVLRACPPASGVTPGLEWLKGQQQVDGGWGSPAAPLYRRISTIAAILTLLRAEVVYRDGDDSKLRPLWGGGALGASLLLPSDEQVLWGDSLLRPG